MSRVFGTKSRASLTGVHPDLQRVMALALVESPVDFAVIECLRSIEKQRINVAKGASKTMDSRHIQGCAVDVWPIDPKTKKLAVSGSAAAEKNLWVLLGQINHAVKSAATRLGVPIVWGGDWTKFKDGPHFELRKAAYPNGIKFASLDPATLVSGATNELA